MVEIKFCGITRPEDAELAVELGASYVGVIFAGGPRLVTATTAREVFGAVEGSTVRRVGVFGPQAADEVLALARESALHVLQLAGEVSERTLIHLREAFVGAIWPVLRVPPESADVRLAALPLLAAGAEAVVLDAAVPGRLGGTGVALDWKAIAPSVAAVRARGRVVLAGGLRAANVATAITLVAPDVVDVSSGVERAPGIKDPQQMRAFANAVRAHEV